MAKVRVNRGKRWELIFSLLVKLIVSLVILLALAIFCLPDPFKNSMNLDTGEQRLGESDERWTEVISWQPRAFIYHNFLSREECQYLIDLARPDMTRTEVFSDDRSRLVESSARTSTGTSFCRGETEIIRDIEKRIATFTFIPIENGERLQILHYDVGQKYDPHYDAFREKEEIKALGLRSATLLMYLSDVEEGGETVFPDGNFTSSYSKNGVNEFSECAKNGMAVKPKLGDALLFWSAKPDATVDPLSLHGGCPVIKGHKWISTKWLYAEEYSLSL